jgi:hypothetical protein
MGGQKRIVFSELRLPEYSDQPQIAISFRNLLGSILARAEGAQIFQQITAGFAIVLQQQIRNLGFAYIFELLGP